MKEWIVYSLIAGMVTFVWLWKTRLQKNVRIDVDKPCHCLHPIKCDLFDKCMRGEK